MENKSFGELLFDYSVEWNDKNNLKNNYRSWNDFPDSLKEPYEYMANKLIQYYEDYLLKEFLDKYRGNDDSK